MSSMSSGFIIKIRVGVRRVCVRCSLWERLEPFSAGVWPMANAPSERDANIHEKCFV